MKQVPWLPREHCAFPDISEALDEPNGLLAVGGDLSVERLLQAYRCGVFPWYEAGQPLLWWSPDPRCVIDPHTFSPGHSLARRLRKQDFEIFVDRDFKSVIEHCRRRPGADGSTWITPEMKDAYVRLHEAGFAHSVECYIKDQLAGGLYGVSLGRLFFGESMFHRVTDASKIAFASLMALMVRAQSPMVDCQVTSRHLESLGTTDIPRDEFRALLKQGLSAPDIDWRELTGKVNLAP